MNDPAISPWKRLVNLLKLDRKDILQIIYYAIFAGLVNLSLPLGIQAIINLIQGAEISTSWIILVVLVTLGVAFVGILQLMQFRIIENVQQKIFTRASFEFAYRFPKIKMESFSTYYPPELANRFFDTVTVQKEITKILLDFPAALLQIIFGLLLLSLYHPFFIVYGVLLIILIYLIIKFTGKKGMVTSLEESTHKYRIAHWLQEIARSVTSFKLSGKTSLAMRKNDALVTRYLSARESHFKVLVLQFIQLITFKVLVTAGLLLIGGILVLNQEMNIGQFVAAEIIILLIISAVEKLILRLESFYDLLTSLEKLGQVVDKELETQQGAHPFQNQHRFSLELDGVSYHARDNGDLLLDNVSMKIDSQTRLHISGASGAGKSTLLQLISGILDASKGNIYVNGLSMKGILPNGYRAGIGQSLSEETPFEGTVLENLTFGDPEISQEDVQHAITVTGLTEFVKKLPKGLDTVIYPEGKKIPFTVAKKIVLARSIVTSPKLLLLNEPLEQLEPQEQERIIAYLTASERPWSLVVVSQNPLWKKYCNTFATMANGRFNLNA
ncbi:peptidase domain-containing ABC transporter [Altibacter sp. HG106]|uniref:peptidase domain-containing ABC transporter n=1 Tax=Altibacter sp. HG106 TaxID=3023937 RepID=UPI0023509D81|nr:ATP-binding cassette domain-containing protein [Altibacter sp. HG106]MDC7994057.1 ATP-binding cassette domain-containing protein [Altibacter sp. HG106]